MIARGLLIVGLVMVAGCSGADDRAPSPSDTESAETVEAPDVDDLQPAPSGLQAPVPEADPGELAPPLVGTLVSAQDGDRACYLTLADDIGTEVVVLASFDLCGPPDLVGQRVRLTYAPSEVMAESCEGEPDCPDTDTVLLAVAMEPDA